MNNYTKIKELIKKPLANDKNIVEIIMLKYKEPEVEKEAISRIIGNTDYPFKLTVYDNRINENNKNTAKIWNKLIKQSRHNYVLIMDSDVFVSRTKPCWLTRLMETFEQKKDAYVVSPVLDRTSGRQQAAKRALPYPQEPEEMRTIYAGQCILYKKSIFKKLGYFNEEYYVYGQDSEFALRLLHSPYKGYIRKDVFVHHIGSYSLGRTAERKEYDAVAEREYAGLLFLLHQKKYEQLR